MRRIRIIDLGLVDWRTSQAIFHGIAHTMTAETPDTITICSPRTPYVCVGYHQQVEKEVDLEYCRSAGIPVTRREVGGGAVYLDKDQIFWHAIFHQDRVPLQIEEVYRLFLAAPVAAHRAMGIEAFHRPVNDLQVAGRKIGGTGAALIGDAMVVVGSLLMDFDYKQMAHVLKVPSEKFRDKVYQSLNEYLTTIRRELGEAAPSREEAQRLLISSFAEVMGAEVFFGGLTPAEEAAVAAMEQRLEDPAWIFEDGGLPKLGVKISEGVRVLESAFKAPGGLIRATVRVKDGRIDDIGFTGDFFIYPADSLAELQAELLGLPWEEERLAEQIRNHYARRSIQSPGITPADLAHAVALAAEPA